MKYLTLPSVRAKTRFELDMSSIFDQKIQLERIHKRTFTGQCMLDKSQFDDRSSYMQELLGRNYIQRAWNRISSSSYFDNRVLDTMYSYTYTFTNPDFPDCKYHIVFSRMCKQSIYAMSMTVTNKYF